MPTTLVVLFSVLSGTLVLAHDNCNRSDACLLSHTDITTSDACVFTEDVKREATERYSSETALVHSLLSLSAPFAPISSKVNNTRCLQHSHRFLEELKRLSLWAMHMHDSTAKLPSGILNGNVDQYGDYDQCIDIASPDDEVHGKYCLASVQVDLIQPASPTLQLLHRLMRANYGFKSEIDDPGHRVPRFSSMNWGLCVPASCNAADVQESLEDVLQTRIANIGVAIKVRVREHMCQGKGSRTLPLSVLATGLLFLSIILTALFSTVLHYYNGPQKVVNQNRLMQYIYAFSLDRNWRTLFKGEQSEDDITAIHFIRFINGYMLILSHKSMAIFFEPYINRTYMVTSISKPFSTLTRSASLYTDPFIMMSGLLTSYSFIRTLDRSGKLNVRKEFASRLIRLLPNLVAIILFSTFILPSLGSGPLWNLVVGEHSDLCKKYWWRNILLIHNYFGFKNMCLTHTHHVAIDSQLFLVSPLLVYIAWRWPKRGLAFLISLAVVSAAMRYYASFTKDLSLFVFYGISVSQMFNTADYTYILPTHRATVYILGILLGYALRRLDKNFKMKKSNVIYGTSVVFLLFYSSYLLPSSMGMPSYKYDSFHAALYAAFAPVAWCLCFVWLTLLSFTSGSGSLNNFLSARFFRVWTKISYAVYLTQFPIFFYNIGSNRTASNYKFLYQLAASETMVIVVSSIMLTLFIDLPFQNIKTILLKKEK